MLFLWQIVFNRLFYFSLNKTVINKVEHAPANVWTCKIAYKHFILNLFVNDSCNSTENSNEIDYFISIKNKVEQTSAFCKIGS